MKKLSFVIPVYNEADGLSHFLDDLLLPEIKKITNYQTEIILVDDGSRDRSLALMQDYSKRNSSIKTVALSRNFGKEPALAAGISVATGDAVITIDADGQQPPSILPKFITAWENGADVVVGVRDRFTKHGLIPRLGSKLFYALLRLMGNRHTVPGSTDFRLIDRVVIDEFNRLPEHNRITRGLIDWLGFNQIHISYTYGARYAGKPSYNFKKLFLLAIDSFISMSTTPLVIFGYIGALITIFSFILGIFIIVNQYILGDPLRLYWNGSIQMAVFITFLVGLVLISQAITALYISHIHAETKSRPLFIINPKTSRGLSSNNKSKP